jgi:hypothetical protein
MLYKYSIQYMQAVKSHSQTNINCNNLILFIINFKFK